MVKEVLSYFKFGNRFYGVEQTHINGQIKYYGLALKKKKKALEVDHSFEATEIEELQSEIPRGKPIVLVINTDSILTKKVRNAGSNILKIVNMAFPNITPEDFYYQTINQGEYCFISICRKSYLDELLKCYLEHNITVIEVVLGNLIVSSLTPYSKQTQFQTSNALISLEGECITHIKNETPQVNLIYKMNGIAIKDHNLLSFAAALNSVIKSQLLETNLNEKTRTLTQTFIEKQFSNHFIKISFGFLFMVLLFNTFFLFHYQEKVGGLNETSMVLELSKNKVVTLSKKVEKTQKMVEDVLKGSASKSSFYVNTIIHGLPNSILLTELNYQPLRKKIKEDEAIENLINTILISGNVNSSASFSLWISQLEKMHWVDTVKILNFEDISKTTSSFSINISINYDTKN